MKVKHINFLVVVILCLSFALLMPSVSNAKKVNWKRNYKGTDHITGTSMTYRNSRKLAVTLPSNGSLDRLTTENIQLSCFTTNKSGGNEKENINSAVANFQGKRAYSYKFLPLLIVGKKQTLNCRAQTLDGAISVTVYNMKRF